MRTKTITTPAGEDLNSLLAIIENTPDAFTNGRRNNDMVNWFLVQKMLNIDNGGPALSTSDYVEKFRECMSNMSKAQQIDLKYWTDGWEQKIEDLTAYYGRLTNPQQIINLWLPMDYSI